MAVRKEFRGVGMKMELNLLSLILKTIFMKGAVSNGTKMVNCTNIFNIKMAKKAVCNFGKIKMEV